MFSVIQHQRRRRQMCGKYSQIHPEHSLFLCYKILLVLTEQSIYGKLSTSFGCPLMLRKNYRCVQSRNISADFAKWVENVQKFTQVHSLFVRCKKWFVFIWTTYSWQGFNWWGCPRMLKTNYMNVFSNSTSVQNVVKCVKKFAQIHTVHSLFLLLQNITSVDRTIYSWQSLNSIRCPLMPRTNCRWVQSLNISVERRQMCGKYSQIHPVHSLFVRYNKGLVLIEKYIHGKISTH